MDDENYVSSLRDEKLLISERDGKRDRERGRERYTDRPTEK